MITKGELWQAMNIVLLPLQKDDENTCNDFQAARTVGGQSGAGERGYDMKHIFKNCPESENERFYFDL